MNLEFRNINFFLFIYIYFLQLKDHIAVDIQNNYYFNFGLNFIVGPLWYISEYLIFHIDDHLLFL